MESVKIWMRQIIFCNDRENEQGQASLKIHNNSLRFHSLNTVWGLCPFHPHSSKSLPYCAARQMSASHAAGSACSGEYHKYSALLQSIAYCTLIQTRTSWKLTLSWVVTPVRKLQTPKRFWWWPSLPFLPFLTPFSGNPKGLSEKLSSSNLTSSLNSLLCLINSIIIFQKTSTLLRLWRSKMIKVFGLSWREMFERQPSELLQSITYLFLVGSEQNLSVSPSLLTNTGQRPCTVPMHTLQVFFIHSLPLFQ